MARPSGEFGQAQCRRSSSAKPSSSGMRLPKRANRVGSGGRRKRGVDHARPCATAATCTIAPLASITALIPVGVERITGMPSSAARSRAWARCCGGPQRPNQASFDGLKMKSGRLRAIDDLAREDDLVAQLEADLAPAGQRNRARTRAGVEVDVAGREPRQADRRQQRPHRQIFAVRDEMRLVVAAERRARPGQARRRCWRRRRSGGRPCENKAIPPVSR